MLKKCPPRQSPVQEYKDLTYRERKWESYRELSPILISRTPYDCFAAVLVSVAGANKSKFLLFQYRQHAYCLRGSQMCIVIGPRLKLAIALINSMKQLFTERDLMQFGTNETILQLNGVHIEAYPSHHLDAMRGIPNVSFILLDEANFSPPGQQQDARDVSERYIAKSNPWIVMVSTPNAPEGLFEKIEREPVYTNGYS